jgi:hypothetical protein
MCAPQEDHEESVPVVQALVAMCSEADLAARLLGAQGAGMVVALAAIAAQDPVPAAARQQAATAVVHLARQHGGQVAALVAGLPPDQQEALQHWAQP